MFGLCLGVDPSRLAALLVLSIRGVCAVLAPCQIGASTPKHRKLLLREPFTNTVSFVAIDPWSFRSLSIQHPRQDLSRLIVPLSEKFKKPLIIFHLRPGAELLAMPRTRPGQEETRKKKERPVRVFMTFFCRIPKPSHSISIWICINTLVRQIGSRSFGLLMISVTLSLLWKQGTHVLEITGFIQVSSDSSWVIPKQENRPV